MSLKYKNRPILLQLVVALLAVNFALADEIDDYMKSQMDEQHIPGVSLAVIRKGTVIKSAGYGWTDVENKIPVTAHTIFQLQSITKTFTATAVMMPGE